VHFLIYDTNVSWPRLLAPFVNRRFVAIFVVDRTLITWVWILKKMKRVIF